MALVYYPKSTLMLRRDTVSASYEQVVLSTYPNTILYFGSGSQLEELSASLFYITSSWAQYSISASYAPGSPSVSASYATTASYALNGGGGGASLTTGSTYPITSSWAVTASLALNSNTASVSTTASYALTSSLSSTSSHVAGNVYVPYTGSTGRVDLTPYPITASNIIHIGVDAPLNPIAGKLWWDSDDTTAQAAIRVRYAINTFTGSITLNANSHFTALISASSSPIYVTLPAASTNNNVMFNIKKIDNTTHSVYINTADSSSIDDSNPISIVTQYNNLTVQCNGSQYYII